MLNCYNRTKNNIPEVKIALRILDNVKRKSYESPLVVDLAKEYVNPQSWLFRLPNGVLYLIVSYIADKLDREIHTRANIYNEYLSNKYNSSAQENYLHTINNLAHKAIWYGVKIDEQLQSIELPKFLHLAMQEDDFRFANAECKVFLQYMVKIINSHSSNLGPDAEQITTLANNKFGYEFYLYEKLNSSLVKNLNAMPFKVVVVIYVTCMSTLITLLILSMIESNVAPAYIPCLVLMFPIGLSPVLCSLCSSYTDGLYAFKGNTAFWGDRFVVHYNRGLNLLGEYFDINVMVKKLCIDLQRLSIDNISHEPILIQFSDFEQEVLASVAHLPDGLVDLEYGNRLAINRM